MTVHEIVPSRLVIGPGARVLVVSTRAASEAADSVVDVLGDRVVLRFDRRRSDGSIRESWSDAFKRGLGRADHLVISSMSRLESGAVRMVRPCLEPAPYHATSPT